MLIDHHLKILHIIVSAFLFSALLGNIVIQSIHSQKLKRLCMQISIIGVPIALMIQFLSGLLLVHFATFAFSKGWIPSVLSTYALSVVAWLVVIFFQLRDYDVAASAGQRRLLNVALFFIALCWAALVYLMTGFK